MGTTISHIHTNRGYLNKYRLLCHLSKNISRENRDQLKFNKMCEIITLIQTLTILMVKRLCIHDSYPLTTICTF